MWPTWSFREIVLNIDRGGGNFNDFKDIAPPPQFRAMQSRPSNSSPQINFAGYDFQRNVLWTHLKEQYISMYMKNIDTPPILAYFLSILQTLLPTILSEIRMEAATPQKNSFKFNLHSHQNWKWMFSTLSLMPQNENCKNVKT